MLILAMDIIDKLNLFLELRCKMSVEGECCAIAVPYMQYRSACTFFRHKMLTIYPHCHIAYFTALTPRPCGTAVTVCSNYILDTIDFWFDIQMLRSDSQPLTRFKTLVGLLQKRPALLQSRDHTLHALPCIAQ